MAIRRTGRVARRRGTAMDDLLGRRLVTGARREADIRRPMVDARRGMAATAVANRRRARVVRRVVGAVQEAGHQAAVGAAVHRVVAQAGRRVAGIRVAVRQVVAEAVAVAEAVVEVAVAEVAIADRQAAAAVVAAVASSAQAT